MKAYTATPHFYPSVEGLLKLGGINEVSVLPEKKSWKSLGEIDLLVLTGGEDVNPARYGENSAGIHFSEMRDEEEFEILDAVLSGELKPRKVFGICRGLQVINVHHGGTLVRDIGQYVGRPHDFSHKLIHKIRGEYNPLFFLETVNSLHHQAVSRIGRGKNGEFLPHVFSVNNYDSLPEIVAWSNTYLGVQFHPEFFPETLKEKKKFAETLRDWIKGKVNFGRVPENKPQNKPRIEREINIEDFSGTETASYRYITDEENFDETI